MVAEVDHPLGRLDHAAAPALGRFERASVLDGGAGGHATIVLSTGPARERSGVRAEVRPGGATEMDSVAQLSRGSWRMSV